jgi:hypothetical protein
MYRWLLFLFLKIILIYHFFSCHEKNVINRVHIITGFIEGTTSIRQVEIFNDSTFEITVINFFDKKNITGIWHISKDTIYLLSKKKQVAKIQFFPNLESFQFIVTESDSVFQDRMFRDMQLYWKNKK